jgi:hypothetical protein
MAQAYGNIAELTGRLAKLKHGLWKRETETVARNLFSSSADKSLVRQLLYQMEHEWPQTEVERVLGYFQNPEVEQSGYKLIIEREVHQPKAIRELTALIGQTGISGYVVNPQDKKVIDAALRAVNIPVEQAGLETSLIRHKATEVLLKSNRPDRNITEALLKQYENAKKYSFLRDEMFVLELGLLRRGETLDQFPATLEILQSRIKGNIVTKYILGNPGIQAPAFKPVLKLLGEQIKLGDHDTAFAMLLAEGSQKSFQDIEKLIEATGAKPTTRLQKHLERFKKVKQESVPKALPEDQKLN